MTNTTSKTLLVGAASSIIIAAGLALACSDSQGPTVTTTRPSPFLVSSPVPAPLVASSRALAAQLASPVVYVSLPPGTIPAGVAATIRNVRSDSSVITGIIDGGFDPVALPAAVADTLTVTVETTGNAGPISSRLVVPPSVILRVVRTNPPAHKRAVPLNSIMVIVFGQPLDSATLNTGSVQLWRGTTAVPGTVRFADVGHLIAEFQPINFLDAQTDYQLTVTQDVRDINGGALEGPLSVQFTTSATVQVPSQLGFVVPPRDAVADAVISPAVVVAIQDASGQTVTGVSGPVTLTLGGSTGGATLYGTTTVNAVNGMATFKDLWIDKAGSGYTLAAAASTLSGSSAAFVITPDTTHFVSHLEFLIQPTNVQAGSPIGPPVQVAVRDLFGNTVTTSNGNVSLALLGGNPQDFKGARTVAAVNGVATFSDLSVTQASDAYQLIASAPGIAQVISRNFAVTTGPAAVLRLDNQPSNGIAGLRLPDEIGVTVYDTLGNAVPSFTGAITLALAPNSSGAVLSVASSQSRPGGATFNGIKIDRQGAAFALVASATGLPDATSGPFDIGPAIGPASRLIAFDGIYVMDQDSKGIGALGVAGGHPAWSPDGSRIAFSGGGSIGLMNYDGSGVTTLVGGGDALWSPTWSPDGQQIAFAGSFGGNQAIWVMNVDGTAFRRLVPIVAVSGASTVTWQPFGQNIVFSSDTGSNRGVYVVNLDGSGLTRLADGDDPAWSPEGTRIAYFCPAAGQICVMNANGSGSTTMLQAWLAGHIAWSPDAAWIAYSTVAFDNWGFDVTYGQIYVVKVDGSELTKVTNLVNGATWPAWRP